MECLTKFRKEDVINEVLKSVNLTSTIFCRSELGAPWGFSVAGRDVAGFHIIKRGDCWLRVGSAKSMTKLAAGDLVILTRGDDHSVTDAPETPPTRLDVLVAKQQLDEKNTFRAGGTGAVTELICGGFFLRDMKVNPLLCTLPGLIHIKGRDRQAAPWLHKTLNLIAEEMKSNRPGAESVVTRLSDVIFIQAVRAFLATKEGHQGGWLRGLEDPQIGFAINLIHQQPEFRWTVQALGTRVGLSRSSFADRFQSLVGESPLHYVTRWRLNKAAVLLRTTKAKLPEIGARVGYESEFAFGRAFKRGTGFSPGSYRNSVKNGSD
jgi:AraC family transcriptional regulator, alkane utilization regulator